MALLTIFLLAIAACIFIALESRGEKRLPERRVRVEEPEDWDWPDR